MTVFKEGTITRAGRLEGKRALVTAAADGIGRASSEMLAREGARVLATDINSQRLQSLRTESELIDAAVLDATDPSAVSQLLANERFDVVLNCVGWVHHGTIQSCEEADWRRSFALNVDSMYHVCRAVLPGMIAAGGGSIINISSVVSSIKGAPNRFAYGATKAAVIGLTRSLAADYVQDNIRCNVICPGTVRTPSLEQRVAALDGSADQNWKAFAERQPMRRLGRPDEVASLVVHLASDESSFSTGGVYTIDGGWSA